MLSKAACEREIRELHDQFVRWYRQDSEAEFERITRALAPSFELIAPDGTVHDRRAILERVRSTRNAHTTFAIEIRNVTPVVVEENHALVRYEEWQSEPGIESGRLSTAFFVSPENDAGDRLETAPDARWVHVHETWLEPPE